MTIQVRCSKCKVVNRVQVNGRIPKCGRCGTSFAKGTVFIPPDELHLLVEGLGDDSDREYVIKKFLRTESQKKWLQEQDITITQLLTGKATIEQSDYAHDNIYPDWNAKVGQKIFGTGGRASDLFKETAKRLKDFGINDIKWE